MTMTMTVTVTMMMAMITVMTLVIMMVMVVMAMTMTTMMIIMVMMMTTTTIGSDGRLRQRVGNHLQMETANVTETNSNEPLKRKDKTSSQTKKAKRII